MKVKKIIIVYCLCSFGAIAQTTDSLTTNNVFEVDSLIAFAKTQLGTNYCYATSDPNIGFDCSGFVYYVFNHFHIKVPRSSKEFKNFGLTIPLDSAKKGDVIVFTGTNAKYRSPGHVGIIIENKEGLPTFIHSSSGKKKGVIISDFNESPYYKKRFIKVVRVF
jgi:cell wall-associated NlpC family hydrolase